MRILVLGATGSIGTGVAAELKTHGHQVIGLVRSDQSRAVLEGLGYQTIAGDIRNPEQWSKTVNSVDAIVHAAATFSDDMGEVDRQLIEELDAAAQARSSQLRFIYTGGCWLYGETGDSHATELTPFQPISSFAWMVENAQFLLNSDAFDTAIIHPAMVYHSEGGVFDRFIEQAIARRPIEVWGGGHVRWPLIHRSDLAIAYRLLVERSDLNGYFNASTETGVSVGEIAVKIAEQFGAGLPLIERTMADVVTEHGEWAQGPTLDQQMSSDKLRVATGWMPKYLSFTDVDFG